MFDHLRLNWILRNNERRTRKHGFVGIYVGDYTSGSRVYSVGFDETLGSPEVIAFDLPKSSAQDFVSQVFEELKTKKLVLGDGLAWPEGSDRAGVWREVHPSQIYGDCDWLTFAIARRASRTGDASGLRAFQIVLSDANGILPWEAGYDERLRPLQPALYEPQSDDEVAGAAPV